MGNLSATCAAGLFALALIGGSAMARGPGDSKGPIFTDEERAAIAAKCGSRTGEWDGRNVHFNNGVLDCGNGKRVDDPEVRAIMARLRERVRLRVRDALANAEVARTVASTARERARERMRVQRPQALSGADRARLRADLDRLRIDIQRLREEVRREVQSSLSR